MSNDRAREKRFMAIVMTAWDSVGDDGRRIYKDYAIGLPDKDSTWEHMYNWCLQQEAWVEHIMLAQLGGPGKYG